MLGKKVISIISKRNDNHGLKIISIIPLEYKP